MVDFFVIDNMYLKESEGSGYKLDFQVILYEGSNNIKFNYRMGRSAGENLDVAGIENRDGTVGLRYTGLKTTNNQGLSVLFYLGDPNPEPIDNDGDGYTVDEGDCNDFDKTVYPGAPEICGDNIDNNCNGLVDEGCTGPRIDHDGDGYTVAEGDCDDYDSSINPGAPEICGDNIDNNCNGLVDEDCDRISNKNFYFPLFAASSAKAVIGLINSSEVHNLTGSLKAYDSTGYLLDTFKDVDLQPLATQEFSVAEIFPENDGQIAYVVFEAGNEGVGNGYCRFVGENGTRTASYPALFAENRDQTLDVPCLLYKDGWSTEVDLISLSEKRLTVDIIFNNGASFRAMIKSGGLYKILIDDDLEVLYHGASGYRLGDLPEATALTVNLAPSFVVLDKENDIALGAVLYQSDKNLCAASLNSAESGKFAVPYTVQTSSWWSSMSIYRPERKVRTASDDACKVVFKGLTPEDYGRAVTDSKELFLEPGEVYETLFKGETGLAGETDCEIAGLEFLASGNGWGCLLLPEKGQKNGVIAPVYEIGKDHWSGIALFNPDPDKTAEITLRAYDTNGNYLSKEKHEIKPFGQLVGLPEELFTGDISSIKQIRYVSDRELFGLVINNDYLENDGKKSSIVNVLPSLSLDVTGSKY